tara:strand:- start:256 stop:1041 length:786 start_codon:yes stop_codon:yes gene_type:complete
MLVEGKKIASDLTMQVSEAVSRLERPLKLAAITCAPNFETQKYLDMKKQKAASVGIHLNVIEMPSESSTDDFIDCISQVAKETDGIVVQLPLPPKVDRDEVLAAVPLEKDPDGFRYGEKGACLSPVIGAIDEISLRYGVEWAGKQVAIIGEGRLVGVPAIQYAKQRGSVVSIFNKENFDSSQLAEADIIISGVGVPNLIDYDDVKSGVVIFDAGTSEDGGELVGDVSPAVVSKAALVTPVPGGIGPITVAYLLKNLVALVK